MTYPKPTIESAESIIHREDRKKAFKLWALSHSRAARNLEIPEEYRSLLVPERAYEVSQKQPEVLILNNNDGNLQIMVVDRTDGSKPISDPKAWEQWEVQRKQARLDQANSRIKLPASPPEGVNRMHAKLLPLIESGTIGLNDRILMTVSLTTNAETTGDESLYVSNYDGETNLGIGKDFYTNTLPEFARACGIRVITGINDINNLAFFSDVLGRSSYLDLKPEYQQRFFPNEDPKVERGKEYYTVQFLYEEDKGVCLRNH